MLRGWAVWAGAAGLPLRLDIPGAKEELFQRGVLPSATGIASGAGPGQCDPIQGGPAGANIPKWDSSLQSFRATVSSTSRPLPSPHH